MAVGSRDGCDRTRVTPGTPGSAEPVAGTVLTATRALLLATSPESVTAAVDDFVTALGGRLVAAAEDPHDAVPLDLSLGLRPPVLAVAEAGTSSRELLEHLLPVLVEDARVAVNRLRLVADLELANQVDHGTGLISRSQLTRLLARSGRGDVVVFLDVDDFKSLNDTAGHAAGDRTLAALGALMIGSIRAGDHAARFGGDEIVLLLHRVSVEVAGRRVRDLQSRWLQVRPRAVTFSAGVAPVGARGWEEALVAADSAMYEAKQRGPHQVVVRGGNG